MTLPKVVYKSLYIYGEGYTVFKDVTGAVCRSMEEIRNHTVAVFVDEIPATDYCCYRNDLLEKTGKDSLYAVRPSSQLDSVKVDVCSVVSSMFGFSL